MFKVFSGYRTYIVAILGIAVAAAEAAGIDIPGVNATENWLSLVLEFLGLGTVRAALNGSIADSIIRGLTGAIVPKDPS
jgi:hypothetical protein